MQDKKKRTKKQIRVQDLKPKKDAKGGVHGPNFNQNFNQNFSQKSPTAGN
jgi:hypothetical protein